MCVLKEICGMHMRVVILKPTLSYFSTHRTNWIFPVWELLPDPNKYIFSERYGPGGQFARDGFLIFGLVCLFPRPKHWVCLFSGFRTPFFQRDGGVRFLKKIFKKFFGTCFSDALMPKNFWAWWLKSKRKFRNLKKNFFQKNFKTVEKCI